MATFNDAGEEIRFFKGQQWHVTNYALLAYAALAAAPEWMDTWKVTANILCAVAVGVAALWAGVELGSLEIALSKERKRMKAARCKLPLVQEIHAKFKPSGRWLVIAGLGIAVVGGAVLAISINLSRIPQVFACLTESGVGGPASGGFRSGGRRDPPHASPYGRLGEWP